MGSIEQVSDAGWAKPDIMSFVRQQACIKIPNTPSFVQMNMTNIC